jgi:NitT/TauT family transport system permease protein
MASRAKQSLFSRNGGLNRAAQVMTGPLLLLVVWYIADVTRLVDAKLLPSPAATLTAMWQSIVVGDMVHDVAHTLYRVLYAFALAAVFGIPIGIMLGASEAVYRRAEFLIDFFRSTPATALFPLFMLIFGLDDFSKISLAAFSAWLIIVFNVAYGVLNARKTRILAATSLGASRWRLFKDVMFFETLPQTFVGLRTGISLALVVIVVAEMFIGATDGLGHRIIDAQMGYDLKNMYASILVSGVLGYALNFFFIAIEKNLIHWAGR